MSQSYALDLCDFDEESAYDVGGATSEGRRTGNEDAYFVGVLHPGLTVKRASRDLAIDGEVTGPESALLMIVADGMGGVSKGDLASRLAVEGAACFALRNIVHAAPDWKTSAPRRARSQLTVPGLRNQLSLAIDACDEHVRHHSKEDGDLASTITLAYLVWPMLYVAHVGDTRAYVLRGGKLLQITRDHIVDPASVRGSSGKRTSGEYWRDVLWNCLGMHEHVAQPDVMKFVLDRHDQWLLCSDGLYETLSEQRMAEIMLSHQDASEAANALIREASRHGASDNVTAVCGRRPGDSFS